MGLLAAKSGAVAMALGHTVRERDGLDPLVIDVGRATLRAFFPYGARAVDVPCAMVPGLGVVRDFPGDLLERPDMFRLALADLADSYPAEPEEAQP